MTDPSTDPVGTVRRETFDSGYSVYAYLPLHSPVWDDHKNRWTCIYSTHAGNVGEDLGGTEVEWLRENAPVIGAVPGTPAAEQDEAEHVIEFREGGWTIKHPLSCRPGLFECPVNRAAEEQLTEPPEVLGRFFASLTDDGLLWVGDPADDAASAAPRSAVEEMANQACTCAPLLTSAGPRRLTALECPEHGEAK